MSDGLNLDQLTLHNHDPAEVVSARDEGSTVIARILASYRSSWMRDALCAEFDTDLWFPRRGERNTAALEICGRCTVRSDCLAEALDDDSLDYGIRGGMTANARRNARLQRASSSSAGTCPDTTT